MDLSKVATAITEAGKQRFGTFALFKSTYNRTTRSDLFVGRGLLPQKPFHMHVFNATCLSTSRAAVPRHPEGIGKVYRQGVWATGRRT